VKDEMEVLMNDSPVLERIEDHVGIISINRPEKHNAMDDAAQAALAAAVARMAADPAVRVIVLRGEGKSFCAGRDTSVLGQRAEGESDYVFVRRAQQIQHKLMDCPKPIIAAVRGAAIGGGFEFALVSDMRVVGRSARMSLPEIMYGLLPDMGGTQTLMTMIGRARTKYYVMTGKAISGEEAFEMGIADWLEDDEQVDDKALEIAREIAARPPQNVMMAKTLVDQFWIGGLKRGLNQELNSITALFKTEDYAEARAAIREKRKPRFKGK
jgi:enoyl-CoA hydratase/carnithine racemase